MTNCSRNSSPNSTTSSSAGTVTSSTSMMHLRPYEYDQVRVELQDMQLWQTFTSDIRNEMIITKSGRKLFPVMRVKIRGLDPTRVYSVSMDFHQVGQSRYKYTDGGWTPAGKAEPQPTGSTYVHHKAPHFGSFWMGEVIDFSKVKVSNKKSHDKIWLNSLHLYEPRISIFRIDPMAKETAVLILEKRLEICSFMAVTSYQNEAITSLKVKHNPYAKGFQDSRAFRHRMEERAANGELSPPPVTPGATDYSNGLTNVSGWNTAEVLQVQNAFPASFPAYHQFGQVQSHRYNPYTRNGPKQERGYSLDLSPSHVSSSSSALLQRRHTNTIHSSRYTQPAKSFENSSYPSYYGYGPIDLSNVNVAANQSEPYSPTVSSSQVSYGQGVGDYYAVYYGGPAYANSSYSAGTLPRGTWDSGYVLGQQGEKSYYQAVGSQAGSPTNGSLQDGSLGSNHENVPTGHGILY